MRYRCCCYKFGDSERIVMVVASQCCSYRSFASQLLYCTRTIGLFPSDPSSADPSGVREMLCRGDEMGLLVINSMQDPLISLLSSALFVSACLLVHMYYIECKRVSDKLEKGQNSEGEG